MLLDGGDAREDLVDAALLVGPLQQPHEALGAGQLTAEVVVVQGQVVGEQPGEPVVGRGARCSSAMNSFSRTSSGAGCARGAASGAGAVRPA
ncbi:hypothetical protein O1M54_41820 [Streptomyces diastatochromogenes]|nr:hypothetical protein [Streptomyces diastatochromogenes]